MKRLLTAIAAAFVLVSPNPDPLVKYLQAYIEGLCWSLDRKNKDAATSLLAERLS